MNGRRRPLAPFLPHRMPCALQNGCNRHEKRRGARGKWQCWPLALTRLAGARRPGRPSRHRSRRSCRKTRRVRPRTRACAWHQQANEQARRQRVAAPAPMDLACSTNERASAVSRREARGGGEEAATLRTSPWTSRRCCSDRYFLKSSHGWWRWHGGAPGEKIRDDEEAVLFVGTELLVRDMHHWLAPPGRAGALDQMYVVILKISVLRVQLYGPMV